ncbi:MAG: hypothetical protein ACD_39C02087G0003 [uncultured bacterium]|nr:MAG: hypothetical protein ACD_39C02087G0003 [uncultured bacterium]
MPLGKVIFRIFCNYCSNGVFSEIVKGFKSIRYLVDFELNNLNVFIDADSSRKSCLISFFEASIKRKESRIAWNWTFVFSGI